MISYCVPEAGARANGGDGAVDRLAAALRAAGISVFVGETASTAGMQWAQTIEEAIKKCKVFVALCTPTYGESEASNWTYRELLTADNLHKPIVAVWHSGRFPPPNVKIFLSGVQRMPRGRKPLTNSTVDLDAVVAELLDALAIFGVKAVSSAGDAKVEGLVELVERSRLSHKLEEMRRWCEAMGATSVDDITNWQKLADEVGLKKLERKRLEEALAATSKPHTVVQSKAMHVAAAAPPAASNRTTRAATSNKSSIAQLIAELKQGTNGQKEKAARVLGTLASNEVNQITIAKAGGIAPLVTIVQSGNARQKKEAAAALWNLAANNDNNKISIAKAGGIAPLVTLVQSGNDAQKEKAAGALWNLAVNNDNQISIAVAGGIAPLVTLVQSGNDAQKEKAAGALWNLAVNNDNQISIAVAGGIAPLVTLVQSGNDAQKEKAAGALCNLARHRDNRRMMKRLGYNSYTG